MVRTFKDVINDIKNFCNNHNQINGFGWGNIDNISTKDHDYTMLWLQPTTTNIEGHLLILNFDMYVFDIVKQNNDNLLYVMNNCLFIGKDVISKFWDNEEEYEWTLNEEIVNAEAYDMRFDDYTAGWVFSIQIEIENRLGSCSIPESVTIVEPVETLYYIASPSDILGTDRIIRWGSVTEYPSYVTLGDMNLEPTPVDIDDKLYIGQSSTEIVKNEVTVIDKYFNGKWALDIDYPNFKSEGYGRIAKLTPFTQATYSNANIGEQIVNSIEFKDVDLRSVYTAGSKVRITDESENVFYGIIETISYDGRHTTIQTYLKKYVTSGNLTVEKMTDIS